VNQEKFAKEILKKFKMEDCAKVNTPVEYGVNMSKNNEGKKINSITFESLVGSLRYLTCTCPNILYEAGLVSRFMETPTMTNFKALKRILRCIKGTINLHLLYGYSNSFDLVCYNNNDWVEDMDDK